MNVKKTPLFLSLALLIVSAIFFTNIGEILGVGVGDADTLDSWHWTGGASNIKDYIDGKAGASVEYAYSSSAWTGGGWGWETIGSVTVDSTGHPSVNIRTAGSIYYNKNSIGAQLRILRDGVQIYLFSGTTGACNSIGCMMSFGQYRTDTISPGSHTYSLQVTSRDSPLVGYNIFVDNYIFLAEPN